MSGIFRWLADSDRVVFRLPRLDALVAEHGVDWTETIV
jgi:hypothetical protein